MLKLVLVTAALINSLQPVEVSMSRAFEIKPQDPVPSEDKAWLLGHLAGDGSFCNSGNRRSVSVSAGTDRDVAEMCVKLFQDIYGATTKTLIQSPGKNKRKQESYVVECYWINVVRDLLSIGSFGVANWRVPRVILQGSDENKCAWLSGIFDADGSIYFKPEKGRRTVNLTSINKAGLDQVSELLLGLGIRHGRGFRKGDGRSRDSYLIYITYHEDLERFAARVGFRSPRKQEKLLLAVSSYVRRVRRSEDVKKHEKEILRRRRQGETHAAIADSLGFIREVVADVCYRNGVEPKGREGNADGGRRSIAPGPSEKKLQDVLALKAQGRTQQEIAQALGFKNPQAVQSLLQRAARKGEIERFARKRTFDQKLSEVIALRRAKKMWAEIASEVYGRSDENAGAYVATIAQRAKKAGLWPADLEKGSPSA